MGIRYYASTWPAEHEDLILTRPERALPDDPFMEVWSRLPLEHPEMLYLDKLWPEFQHLTGAVDDQEARRAFRLFEGQVTYVGFGWRPWYRAIAPHEVRVIARDLATVSDDDVTARFGSGDTLSSRFALTRADLHQFLARAQRFTSDAAARGRGISYQIG